MKLQQDIQTICVRIDGETKEKLRALANAQQRSLAGQVRQLIREFVREQEAFQGDTPSGGLLSSSRK